MYKWFVWSSEEQKYLPLPGLFRVSRARYPAEVIDMFGNPVVPAFTIPMFTIPMFGVHNAVK